MKKFYAFFAAALMSVSVFASRDVVPADGVLADYYEAGNVCVCFFVPAEMNCNNIVLTGSFNGWSSDLAACVAVEAVDGYDGWYVGSFAPEEEPDATKGIQAKPIMLGADGKFNWSYQVGDAEAIRGGVQVVQGSYAGEIDLINYGTDAPNVFAVNAWKENPCDAIFHDYKFTVISDGCDGYVLPFIVGSFTNWAFTQMEYDLEQSEALGADVYSLKIKAAEHSQFQFVSGMWNDEGEVGVQPSWSPEAYLQILTPEGVWIRIPGEDGDNLLTDEFPEITVDVRADSIRWARCAPAEEAEHVAFFVKLPVENAPAAAEVIGTFDGWAGTALTWNPSTNFFEAEFDAKPSDYFKIRGAGSWAQELELYNEAEDEWAKIADNQLIFGQIWEDAAEGKSLTLDLSDPDKARWTGEPTPALEFDYVINVANAPECGEAVLSIVGSFAACNWTVANAVAVEAGVAALHAVNTDEFKFVDKVLGWDNEVIGFAQTTFHAADIADGEEDGNISIDLAEAYFAKCDPQGIENITLTEKAQKVVVDGVLYIVRDNKMYNAQGSQVR